MGLAFSSFPRPARVGLMGHNLGLRQGTETTGLSVFCFQRPRGPHRSPAGSPPQGGREVATRPRPMSQSARREPGRSERSVRVCHSRYRRFLDFTVKLTRSPPCPKGGSDSQNAVRLVLTFGCKGQGR
uniref:Uncharacterized protein n=1 Tax=Rousettus aegyptiacus TaxID=9407 RepID=A0A7J8FJS5_ROUAE|nr:hypothetical protein HJG63_012068 [Rousettus aegyptiacus]